MQARARLRVAAIALGAAILLGIAPSVAFADLIVPAAPTITTPVNLLSRDGNVSVTGIVDAWTSELRIATPSMTVTMAVTPGGPFAATVAIPVARAASVISVTPSNSVGDGPAATVTVFCLGGLPGYDTFVLVDKYDYTLYFIRSGIVVMARPVAIGMPRAQTPVGTWTLGPAKRMRPSTTSWGVLRMPLQRTVSRRVRVRVRVGRRVVRRWVRRQVLVNTSYYIHGTNDPSCIGTMASHGCVRMYNWDVLALSAIVGRSPVVIRN